MAKKSKSSTRGASHTASSAALETGNRPEFRKRVELYYDRRLFKPDESTRPPTAKKPLYARVALQVIHVRQKRRQFHAKLQTFNPLYHARSAIRTRLGFSVPRRLEVCIRRGIRKEVIHATRKAGKAGQRKPVRNFWSAISC